MTPEDFVATYFQDAKICEDDTGIPVVATLTQAALESGWGSAAPGNNFFGIKARRPLVDGQWQLLETTECHTNPDVPYPEIISITQNGDYFDYIVKDYFRKYDTPADSFKDHAQFFLENSRYAQALAVKDDPMAFLQAVADAGYATAPNYAQTLLTLAKQIDSIIFGGQ